MLIPADLQGQGGVAPWVEVAARDDVVGELHDVVEEILFVVATDV